MKNPFIIKKEKVKGINVPHSAGILDDFAIRKDIQTQTITSGEVNTTNITATGVILTGDNSSTDTQFTPQVLYNTDATPPAASGFPIGTIYIQYTP